MAWSVGFLIYAVVQFVAFLLVLVATPINMFWYRDDGFTLFPNRCIFLWGYKRDCRNTNYTASSDSLWARCPVRRNRFRAAQALAVISIVVYGAAFVLGVIMLFCCRWVRWVCLVLNSVGVVTLCIVWAFMAVTYNSNEGTVCTPLNALYTYGAGFVLFLLAWVLDVLNIPVLLLLWQDSDSGRSVKSIDKESKE
ncbi:amastin-like surface protein, putative [Leishmania guyanensis]